MNSLGKTSRSGKTKNVAYEGPGLIIPYYSDAIKYS